MEWNISDNYRSREASEMFHIDKSAENPHFDGFLLHTIKTMDKVVRYGGNNQVDFFEHPTVIQCGDVRTIGAMPPFQMLHRRTSLLHIGNCNCSIL